MRRTLFLAALLVVAIAALVFQQRIRTTLLPGRLVEVAMDRDDALLDTLGLPEGKRMHVPATGEGRYYTPPGVPWPAERVLLTSDPMGGQGKGLVHFGRWAASDVGAMVIDVSVFPLHADDHWGHYYYARHLLRDLREEGVVSSEARVVLTGFSGGGKMALQLGAIGGLDTWQGVLAGGVNQAMAPDILDQMANPSALDLPIILFNGTADHLVTHRSEEVLRELWDAGFTAWLREYEGGHTLDGRAFVPHLEELFGPP